MSKKKEKKIKGLQAGHYVCPECGREARGPVDCCDHFKLAVLKFHGLVEEMPEKKEKEVMDMKCKVCQKELELVQTQIINLEEFGKDKCEARYYCANCHRTFPIDEIKGGD